jgi:hypothetical protein
MQQLNSHSSLMRVPLGPHVLAILRSFTLCLTLQRLQYIAESTSPVVGSEKGHIMDNFSIAALGAAIDLDRLQAYYSSEVP